MARMNGIIFGQQNLWPKAFLAKKNFCSQKILCQKIFGQKIVLISFLVKNKLLVELFLAKKLSKVFGPKFLVKNWLVKKKFWLKIFWSEIFFENCGDKVFGRFFFYWEGLTQREGGCRRPPPPENCRVESSWIILYLLLKLTYGIWVPKLFKFCSLPRGGSTLEAPPPQKIVGLKLLESS